MFSIEFREFSLQGHTSTVNLAQLTDDTKTCYIAQPFGYANYALVNQMPIGQSNNGSYSFNLSPKDISLNFELLKNSEMRIFLINTVRLIFSFNCGRNRNGR